MNLKELNNLGKLLFILGILGLSFLGIYTHNNSIRVECPVNEFFCFFHTQSINYNNNIFWLVIPFFILVAEGIYFMSKEDNKFEQDEKASMFFVGGIVSGLYLLLAWSIGIWFSIIIFMLPCSWWIIVQSNKALIKNVNISRKKKINKKK